MPYYKYQNPNTLEIKEIFQHMNETHTYEELGIKWNRIFDVPNAAIDTEINPFSEREFIEKTKAKKNFTVGDSWDIAKELSEKRAKKAGRDEIKEKTIKKYEKKTDKRHPLAKEIPKEYVITQKPK